MLVTVVAFFFFFDFALLKVPPVTWMAGVLFRTLLPVGVFAVSDRKTTGSNRDGGCPVHNLQDCHCF